MSCKCTWSDAIYLMCMSICFCTHAFVGPGNIYWISDEYAYNFINSVSKNMCSDLQLVQSQKWRLERRSISSWYISEMKTEYTKFIQSQVSWERKQREEMWNRWIVYFLTNLSYSSFNILTTAELLRDDFPNIFLLWCQGRMT